METRRLKTFVRIVEIGSLTRAADILHVAQPALSQQMNALEADLGQRLLVRSRQGVVPTEAGSALYRHAQVILRQVADAVAEVELAGREIAGQVSVGLAPYSTANIVALPLLAAVRTQYPRILVRVSDNFGSVLSEAMMTGRLDMALLYDSGPIRGITFERLISEGLVLVHRAGDQHLPESGIGMEDLAYLPLMLPSPAHTIRKSLTAACESAGVLLTPVAELESVGLMGHAVARGLGVTVLPRSVAERLPRQDALRLVPLNPTIEIHLSLGVPALLPLSRAAECVRDVLRLVVAETLVRPRSRRTPNPGQSTTELGSDEFLG